VQNLIDLTGKVAAITGGGSGIGKGAALAFAECGCRVALIDRTLDSCTETVNEIHQNGGQAEAFPADVTMPDQMRKVYEDVDKRFGRLDIVYANAGINGVWAPIEDLTPEEFDLTIGVNLKGRFLTIKYAVPLLRRQGGSVLVTSSVNGTRIFSNTGANAYSTSKAGQLAMAKMLAVELGQYGIRVNVICPGAISTNIQGSTEQRNTESIKIPVEYPRGTSPLVGDKSGDASQVGRLALFLASDMADHITGVKWSI
jgi:NAD(P)-dependent dehydrogenase (short-subunit alcohol dehydrogenase family)